MKTKKRIFYYDFIRVIAMIMVVTFHFFVQYQYLGIYPVINTLANPKWGIIGVTLFFMISGSLLTHIYGNRLEIKEYFRKRFMNIYPLFWIIYIAFFTYIFISSGAFVWDVSKSSLLLTLFAMDGYVNTIGIKSTYIIGEWFLGCIVILYLIFPILIKAIKKHSRICFALLLSAYLLVIAFSKGVIVPISFNFFVSLFSFTMGIYIEKDDIDFNKKIIIIFALIIPVLYLLPIANPNITLLFGNIMGFALFFVLKHISNNINNNVIKYNIINLSKDSYAIFLVHHYLIIKIETFFQGKQMSLSNGLILYIATWVVIIFVAKIFIFIKDKILDYIKQAKEYKE